MILAYVVLVFSLLTAAVATVVAEWQASRLPPEAAGPQGPPPAAPAGDGAARPTAREVIGLSAGLDADGVHLRFFERPCRVCISSPITELVSTRQRDEDRTVYRMRTRSGSLYLVFMGDATARQVLSTFYRWRNESADGAGKGPC
jgi:hypothetical protein